MAGPPPSGAGGSGQAPDEADGIQVNFCREPVCANFGQPPIGPVHLGRGAGQHNRYARFGRAKKTPALKCNTCGSLAPIKSNRGIAEELARITAYLRLGSAPGCPNGACANHAYPVSLYPDLYQKHGRTRRGHPRFECKACRRTFAAAPPRRRRRPALDAEVFRLIANKVPLRRIVRIADIDARTLYRTIDFIHRKCLAFVGDREQPCPTCASRGFPFLRTARSTS